MKQFDQFGLQIPEILLPRNKNLETWCVVACDQYTQDFDYWKKVAETVGDAPSSLHLVLPEIFLSSPDMESRLKDIRISMNAYLENGIFDSPEKECVYVERKTRYGRVRRGLIAAIDLEQYDWKPFSKSLIRATEATISERIPVRKNIRKNAPVEIPHIMLLVNDPEHLLVEQVGEEAKKNQPLYDGDLMMNSGHISGWAVKSENALEKMFHALEKLKLRNSDSSGNPFLFAVGDGNHSLAAAKAVWDDCRNNGSPDMRARYALVEIVNIYDSGLTFEPIHRVIFNCDAFKLISFLTENCGGQAVEEQNSDSLENAVKNSKADIGFVFLENGKQRYFRMKTDLRELAVCRIQPLLDEFISGCENCGIDYIHGTDEVFRLGAQENATALLFPPVAKDSFFETIDKFGALPRKSFSMGEASEKRFYLECRKLFGNS
ncbi:DUF1015 domain-containing protein [Treponema sp.]|uniref:DUF1015 domain-containing protein n=1 Tax=Treponema sp. TaxID=166 RepID=UPI003F078394